MYVLSEHDAPGPVDWEATAELLALFDISAKFATLSQTEQIFVTALGVLAKEKMMAEFRAHQTRVVDLPNVTPSPRMPAMTRNPMTRTMTSLRSSALTPLPS